MPDTLRPSQTDDAPSLPDWQKALARMGAENGFFRTLGRDHSALFLRGGDTLIVTFENLDHVYERGENRLPWGHAFVTGHGWSMLGLMAHDWTWYRDEAVFDFFDELRDSGFFRDFKRIVFYGASMGGYAAAVFSAAAPGATVIAISPQATLSRAIAPWETRYRKVWARDFSTRYGYAPDMAASAERMYLFVDPTAPLDAMHAALFSGPKLVTLNCRHFGHKIASSWARMGILKPIVAACVDGSFTKPWFYRLLRARRDDMKYQRAMLARLKEADRPARLIHFCRAILARRGAPKFRQALKAAEEDTR